MIGRKVEAATCRKAATRTANQAETGYTLVVIGSPWLAFCSCFESMIVGILIYRELFGEIK